VDVLGEGVHPADPDPAHFDDGELVGVLAEDAVGLDRALQDDDAWIVRAVEGMSSVNEETLNMWQPPGAKDRIAYCAPRLREGAPIVIVSRPV
jgi:hypothetical protein